MKTDWTEIGRQEKVCVVFLFPWRKWQSRKKLEWWQSFASLAGFGHGLGVTLKACSTLPDGFKCSLWNFMFTWLSTKLIALFQNQVSSWCDVPLIDTCDDRRTHTCEVMTLVRCWWEGLFTLVRWWQWGRGGDHTCEVMTGGFTLVRWWQGDSHLWGDDACEVLMRRAVHTGKLMRTGGRFDTCEVMTGEFTFVRWWQGELVFERWWHLWGVNEKGCWHWEGDYKGGGGGGVDTCEVMTLVRWWQGELVFKMRWHLWGVDEKGCWHW